MGVSMAGIPRLLYDRDCRICSATAALVHVVTRSKRLTVQPLQESGSLLGSIPEAERLGALRFVREDGRVVSGGDALPALAAAMVGAPQVERLIQSSPPAVSAVHLTYETLVRLRSRLTCGLSRAS